VIEVAREDGYVVSTDPARLDMDAIHAFLRTSYWSPNVPRAVVERAVRHSIPFGLHAPGGGLAGFARVLSDRATFAYLADVFVLPEHRGRGLGVWLVEQVLAHPELQGLRRWALATADAHELYRRFGFEEPSAPERLMLLDRSPQELYGGEG
jgi:GNAT superfamily N-acetyltransferase